MADFCKFSEKDIHTPGHPMRTVFFNLSAIREVISYGIPGETVCVHALDGRNYYLAGKDAEALLRKLEEKCQEGGER